DLIEKAMQGQQILIQGDSYALRSNSSQSHLMKEPRQAGSARGRYDSRTDIRRPAELIFTTMAYELLDRYRYISLVCQLTISAVE
ncbi:MAG UNVERIFIED_CONTAM: hypothetical protein LVT10_13180, partial [Anaerolineae bacterium]